MKWYKTRFNGVRYREHETRRHGVKRDRYYVITYWWQGKTVTESIGWSSQGVTEKDAAVVLGELISNQKKGQPPFTLKEKREAAQAAVVEKEEQRIQAEREAVTFADLFERYLPISKTTKRNAKSWTREESFFRLWVEPVIGNKPLGDIAPIHIERIKAAMAKSGAAPRSIQYMLSFVKAVFNFAIRNGIFGSNPAAQVKAPKVNNKRIRFLSHDEADRLLEELATTSVQLHDMALLSLHTGMRAGEIFALTWGDIDPARESISIRDSKSGRGRTVYMTEDVKAMLESLSAGGPSEFVFKGRGGQIKMISGGFKRAVDRLGLNDGVDDPRQRVSFHSLRHSYASWLVGAGESLYVVKELLGHSDLTMTQRYSHLAPDSLKSAVKTLQRSIDESGTMDATPVSRVRGAKG